MDSDSDDGSVSSHNSDEQKKTGEYKPDLTSEDAQRARGIISFLFEPSSSLASHIYHLAAAALVLCHILQVCLETCDGPNQYDGRKNLAAYPFLLTESKYRIVEMVFVFPLLLDSLFRVALLAWMQADANLARLALHEIWMDSLRCSTLVAEVIGVLPFLASVIANAQPTQQFWRLTFRIVDLCIISKIVRLIKDVPAVWAIRLTLYAAVPQLILPIFFFVVFNMCAAVLFFYMEPCYDQKTCAWTSLFDSTFFSVVTITTTGYGNQVPVLEYTRLIACLVMVFGVLFMSMPLAIVGNEYEQAWSTVNTKIEERDFVERVMREKRELEILRNKMPISDQIMNLSPDFGGGTGKTNEIREPLPFPKSGFNSIGVAPMSIGSPVPPKTGKPSAAPMRPSIRPAFSKVEEEKDSSSSSSSSSSEDSDDEEKSKPVRTSGTLQSSSRGKSGKDEEDPLARSLIEPLSKIKLLILKTDKLLSVSEKISPAVLLSACELTGWLVPLCYSIRNASHDIKQKCRMFQSECDAQTELLMSEYGSISMIRNTKLAPTQIEIPEMVLKSSLPAGKTKGNPKRLSVLGGSLQQFTDHLARVHQGHETVIEDIKKEKASLSEPLGRKRTISDTIQEQVTLTSASTKTAARKLTDFVLRRQSTVIYEKTLRWAQMNPQSWRAQLWLALEQPHVSTEARILQIFLIVLIFLSLLVLYTESLPSWSHYGESSRLCGKVLEQYCSDKTDNYLDPACYVQTVDTWTGVTFPSTIKLTFGKGYQSDCSDATCFGYGANFGGPNTNMSCAFMDGTTPKLGDTYTDVYLPPFQSSDELLRRYGYATIFTSRKDIHRLSPVCNRIECDYKHQNLVDGNPIWILCESLFNSVFLIELVVRMSVSYNIAEFFLDKMNIIDCMAVAPFILDLLVTAASAEGIEALDLGIIASNPEPMWLTGLRALKVLRLFSLTRHFKSSKVLYETGCKVWKQILSIITLLFFFSVLFGLIMYELERGSPCYYGDAGCTLPTDAVANVGQRILVNKYGDLSLIPNVFYGIWFSIVTMLTVGYGEIVPVTNGGMSMAVCLMLFGAMYMAMPLTAAATNFYLVHDLYKEKTRKREEEKAKFERDIEEKFQKRMARKLQHADDDESDDDATATEFDDKAGPESARRVLTTSFDLTDETDIAVPFKPKNKQSGVDLSTQIYAENVKTAHEQKLKRMKRQVHQFFVSKLMHIQYILNKLLALTDAAEVKTVPTRNGSTERGLSTRFDKLPMFTAKATLLKKLKVDMLANMRVITLAIATNSDSGIKSGSYDVDNHDEVAMTYCLDNLKRTYQTGMANICTYLDTIMVDVVLKNCEARKNSVLRFVEGLQAPPPSAQASHKFPTDAAHSDDVEEEEEEDDEVMDSELQAKQFRRDTLLGKYQLLLNKLNNVIKVADEDIQCLCQVLVYVNKNIDDDIYFAGNS